MKKKMNLTAIIAVVMVAMSSINLVSCTADEEYGDLAFGTLANGMFTRSGENGGGTQQNKDTIENNYTPKFTEIEAGSVEFVHTINDTVKINVCVSWPKGIWALISPQITTSFVDDVDKDSEHEYYLTPSKVYWYTSSCVRGYVNYNTYDIVGRTYKIESDLFIARINVEYSEH